MKTLRQFVTVSMTAPMVAALIAGELAARGAEDFARGWRVGLR